MNLHILQKFIITIFAILIATSNALSLFKLDQNEFLDSFDLNYERNHKPINLNNKYIVIIRITDKDRNNNGKDFKLIARNNFGKQYRKKKMYEEKLRSEHNNRIKEITDFMKEHIEATKYLYKEVKRIERDRQVKDELREMVEYLERPENEAEKAAVLKYFAKNNKIMKKKKISIWDQHINDLVINVVKDPFNDGTVN